MSENRKRFTVSVGEFEYEKNAVARRQVCLDNGLTAKIIDCEDTALTDVVTALTLIAVKMDKLIEAVGNREVIVKDDEPKSLGEFLKKKRKEAGMSAKEVAEGAGVSPNAIYKYERGRTSTNLQKLKFFSQLYGFDMQDALAFLN